MTEVEKIYWAQMTQMTKMTQIHAKQIKRAVFVSFLGQAAPRDDSEADSSSLEKMVGSECSEGGRVSLR